jgi:hypothetical protein
MAGYLLCSVACVCGVVPCPHEGWHICTNPACKALKAPKKKCMKLACKECSRQNETAVPLSSASKPPKRKAPAPTLSAKKKKRAQKKNNEQWDGGSSSDGSFTDSGPDVHTGDIGSTLNGTDSSGSDDSCISDEAAITFEAHRVLKGPRSTDGRYQMSWKGTDEKGRPWRPIWEPESNCTPALLQEYNSKQIKKRTKQEGGGVSESDSDEERLTAIGIHRTREGGHEGSPGSRGNALDLSKCGARRPRDV